MKTNIHFWTYLAQFFLEWEIFQIKVEGKINHISCVLCIYYRYSVLGPIWAETKAQSGDCCGSGTLHPGQILRSSLPLLSPRLDVPTFATRCPHVRHDARDPSGGRWNSGRECCPVILPKRRLPRHLGVFYMPQIYDMGPTALLPRQRKACWGFFRP
jgi:hypothetical protein